MLGSMLGSALGTMEGARAGRAGLNGVRSDAGMSRDAFFCPGPPTLSICQHAARVQTGLVPPTPNAIMRFALCGRG